MGVVRRAAVVTVVVRFVVGAVGVYFRKLPDPADQPVFKLTRERSPASNRLAVGHLRGGRFLVSRGGPRAANRAPTCGRWPRP